MRRGPNTQPFDYSGAQGAVYHSRRRLSPEAETWLARVRAEKIQPYVRSEDSILEYGVGFGWNLMEVECAQKAGFDVAPGLRELVEARGIEFISDLKQAIPATFDVVLSHHTLEHLPNPLNGIVRMLELLKYNGKLLLFVPYERERKFRLYKSMNRARHLYSWTPASFSRLVAAAGASIEKLSVRKFRFDRLAAVLASKLHKSSGVYRLLRAAGLYALPEYELCLIARNSALERACRPCPL